MNKQDTDMNYRLDRLTDYANGSLGFAEAKNAALLTLSIAIVAAILATNPTDECAKALLYLSLLPLIITIFILVISFYPVNSRQKAAKPGKSTDLFSCENIAAMGLEKLTERVLEGSESPLPDLFQQQQLINILRKSQAAARKYQLFRLATRGFVLFLMVFALYLLQLLFKF